MVSFKNVNTKDYRKIKRGLKKQFKTFPCTSNDRSIIETFDIVSFDSKFPVTYYKTKILLVQGDLSNKHSKPVIEFIQESLKIDF
jgi:hypothetical protein